MKEVTNAEKVQARLNLIINGTTDAHNDAIKTSGSFANTTKALASALQELNVVVMQPLLPVLTKIVRGFVDAVESIKSFLAIFKTFTKTGEDTINSAEILQENIKLETKLISLRTQRLLLEKKISDQQLGAFKKFFDAIKGRALKDDESSSLNLLDLLRGPKISLDKSLKALQAEIDEIENLISANDKLIRSQKKVTQSVQEEVKEKMSAEEVFKLRKLGRITEIRLMEKEVEVRERLTGQLLPFQIKLIQGEAKARQFLHGRQLSQIEELKKEELFVEEMEKAVHVHKIERIKELRRITEEETKKIKERQEMIQNEFNSATKSMSKGFSNSLAEMVVDGKFNLDQLSNVFKNFQKRILATALELMVVNKIINSIFGLRGSNALPVASFGQFRGSFSSGVGATAGAGSVGAPVMGGGGRIQKGRPYIVGDRGAELFVPSTGGSLLNNMNTSRVGGGSTIVNQTINVDAGVSQTVRAEMIGFLPVFKRETISSIMEMKRRGGGLSTALT